MILRRCEDFHQAMYTYRGRFPSIFVVSPDLLSCVVGSTTKMAVCDGYLVIIISFMVNILYSFVCYNGE